MKFRFVTIEVARTSETSVDNYFTRQYIPEDKSEQDSYCLMTKQIPLVTANIYGVKSQQHVYSTYLRIITDRCELV